MKVGEKSPEALDTGGKTGAVKKKGATGAPSKVTSKDVAAGNEVVTSAKVRLSDRAQDIKKIKEQVSKTPDVDESKVAKYKSMLAKGEYKIQPDKVADKMVNEHAYNAFFDTEDK